VTVIRGLHSFRAHFLFYVTVIRGLHSFRAHISLLCDHNLGTAIFSGTYFSFM
jgi:hypothetical protein